MREIFGIEESDDLELLGRQEWLRSLRPSTGWQLLAVVGSVRDATDRDNAPVDDVTGTYLRGPGFVELAREIARAKRTQQSLVVVFVDVDGLKAINDSQGHAAGDRILLAVADTLRAKLRPYDVIIRYGGDEFVCVLTGLNLADASERLVSVNTVLADAYDHMSVTLGIAELQENESWQDLVGRADAALYRERAYRRRSRTPEDHSDQRQEPS